MKLLAKSNGTGDAQMVIGAASTILDDITFKADADGLTARCMDPSHVALLDIVWPASAFESYECDGEVSFGLRTTEFLGLLRHAGKTEQVSLGVKDDVLTVEMGRRSTKIKIGESTEGSPLPKITFDANITMDHDQLEAALLDVNAISDYVTVNAGKSTMMSGRGDVGSCEIDIGMESEFDACGTYSLEYLLPFIKSVGLCGFVLSLSDAKPLRLRANTPNGSVIDFYLAPRIES